MLDRRNSPTADRLVGAPPPLGHHRGERLSEMLRLATHQRGALAKDVHLAAARWMNRVPTLLEKHGEIGLDLLSSGREFGNEFVGYGVDLERRIALRTAFSQLPVHTETAGHIVREEDVVDLRH